jgi:peptidoglycan/xylan/chitin deacetylase (PgdA/CDA1 family)
VHGILLHAACEQRRQSGLFDPFTTDTYALAEQIATVASRARVVSLDEVLDHLAEGQPLPAHAVHLSIDQGYVGTLVAAELLERYRLPWTLFVTVDAALDRRLPWFVRLADAVSVSRTVLDPSGRLHDLSDTDGKQRFFSRAAMGLRSRRVDQEEALARFLDLPGMSQPDQSRWPFLEIEHLRELHGAGVAIGCHPASDIGLAGLPEERLEIEISGSRKRLAEFLHSPVRFFAFPYGFSDRRSRSLVRREYELAVGDPGELLGGVRYRLLRRDAGFDRPGIDSALDLGGLTRGQVRTHVRRVGHRLSVRRSITPRPPEHAAP